MLARPALFSAEQKLLPPAGQISASGQVGKTYSTSFPLPLYTVSCWYFKLVLRHWQAPCGLLQFQGSREAEAAEETLVRLKPYCWHLFIQDTMAVHIFALKASLKKITP